MLEITVGGVEKFDSATNTFFNDGTKLVLEHSLVSLSKWESIFEKPFLGVEENTAQENLMYFYCMILTEQVPQSILNDFTEEHVKEIITYIEAKHTATTFSSTGGDAKPGVVTSELIYYWMISYQIPFKCETWFLGRLLTLIHICQVKAEEAEEKANRQKGGKRFRKKLSPSEAATAAQQQRDLNAQRRAQFNTSG